MAAWLGDRFGEVIDCVVMKNAESGRSRGFGFVTFSDPNNMDKVIQSCPHVLDGRTIDPKPCNPRSMQQKPKRNTNWPKVIYLFLFSTMVFNNLLGT
jgi:RNA-binding protein Musashi